VLPNEKFAFSVGCLLHKRAGRQNALQDGSVGCTLSRAGGLHNKLDCREKSGPEGCSFVQPKNFFRVQSTTLADPFKPLNSSLAQLAEELGRW